MEEASKEFINELKSDSKTYKEVQRKLDLFDKEIKYTNSQSQLYKFMNVCFIRYIKGLLEDEKNDLPLTNRSSI